MSDNEQGNGVAGVIGGVAGGVGAGYFAHKHFVKSKIAEAGKGVVEASKAEINAVLGNANHEIHITPCTDAETLKGFGKKQLFTINFHVPDSNGGIGQNSLIFTDKLPEGITIPEGAASLKLTEPAHISAVTAKVDDLAKASHELNVNALAKNTKFIDGLKLTGAGGKAAIAAATVAGIAVGAFVLNALFGGKHTDKIEAERSTPAAEPSR